MTPDIPNSRRGSVSSNASVETPSQPKEVSFPQKIDSTLTPSLPGAPGHPQELQEAADQAGAEGRGHGQKPVGGQGGARGQAKVRAPAVSPGSPRISLISLDLHVTVIFQSVCSQGTQEEGGGRDDARAYREEA